MQNQCSQERAYISLEGTSQKHIGQNMSVSLSLSSSSLSLSRLLVLALNKARDDAAGVSLSLRVKETPCCSKAGRFGGPAQKKGNKLVTKNVYLTALITIKFKKLKKKTKKV